MMFLLLYFGLPAVIAFWVIYRYDLPWLQVVVLSYLPALLFGLYGLGVLVWGGRFEWSALLSPLYFSFVSYAFIFPVLVAASVMTMLYQRLCRPNLWKSMLAGGIFGMLSMYTMEYVTTQDMQHFDWWSGPFAMLLGSLSVSIMYYFVVRRQKRVADAI